MFKRDCSAILGRFYFGIIQVFVRFPLKKIVTMRGYKSNVKNVKDALPTEIFLFKKCLNLDFYVLRLFKKLFIFN